MGQQLHILMVEDSEDDALFLIREVQRAGYEPVFQRVETEPGFKAALAAGGWDVVIADYHLPEYSALEALAFVQRAGIDIPFIMVSGAIGEEVAVGAMKSGAHDYILKSGLTRLVPAVEREIREAQVRRKRREAEDAYQQLAAIVESSGDAIVGKKLDGTITSWNTGAEELFGYLADEVKGESIQMLVPPDRAEEEMRILERLKRGEWIPHFETVRLRKDGRRIDVSITVSPIRDERGEIIGASKIARDITERKRAEIYIAALSKLGQNLSAADTPVEAARVIAAIADELFGWDAFTVDMYDEERNAIHTVLNMDTIIGKKRDVPSSYVDHRPSVMARRVIDSGAELILKEDPNAMLPGALPIGDTARPSASVMYVPVRNRTRVIGILSLHSYSPRAYDRKNLGTFQTLADYCGGALERMQAREELRKSEERYRKLADSSPIGIFETDAEGRCIYANERWTAISGLSLEKSSGFGWVGVIHPDDRPVVQTEWLRTVARGLEWAREYRLITPQGTERWVRARAARLLSADGDSVGYVGTVEDITQNKRVADALRAAQDRLHHLVSSSPAVLYSLKVSGVTLLPSWVSENIAALTGYGPQETLSAQWWAANLHLEAWSQALSEHPGADKLVEEYPFRRKDGKELWVRDEKRLIRDAAGTLVEVVGSWSDITERKIAEEEVRGSREQLRALAAHLQSVREEERKRITREIHDELGQSLTGFKMDLAWIRGRVQTKEGAVNRQPILDKIKAMGALLDETANLVRRLCTELRPGILDDLGLTAAIEWQANEYQKRTGIACQTHLELGDLLVDSERSTALFRIFQEILTNIARHARATRADILLRADGTHVILEVRDNGRGIGESEKAGTKSLGLLGMRERAFILGGEVGIDGAPGKGTIVTVKVPLPQFGKPQGRQAGEGIPETARPSRGRKTLKPERSKNSE